MYFRQVQLLLLEHRHPSGQEINGHRRVEIKPHSWHLREREGDRKRPDNLDEMFFSMSLAIPYDQHLLLPFCSTSRKENSWYQLRPVREK